MEIMAGQTTQDLNLITCEKSEKATEQSSTVGVDKT